MSGFRTCCGFPHGQASMYAMILGISSYLLAISSTWGCYFATVNFIFVDDSPTQYTDVERMGVGLFSYEDTAAASDLTCKLYSKEQMNSFDTGFTVARTFGILANILIGLSMIFLIALSCTVVKKSTLKVVGGMLVLGGILEGFTFLIYTSNVLCETCQVFFGSGLALICSIVTIMNGIITCRIPEVFLDHEDDVFAEEYDAEVTKHHATSSDSYSNDEDGEDGISAIQSVSNHSRVSRNTRNTRGSRHKRHIVKTIVNTDGSRSVERTKAVVLDDADLIGEVY